MKEFDKGEIIVIPKIIHYIWLGGKPLPRIAERCIESWKKFCPDYEIKRWDESNLNLEFCDYVKEAYDCKKFAFASDVLRLQKLYEFGGIYLDVDVELIKPIDEFLDKKTFSGFETSNLLNPGLIFGTEQNNKDLKNILELYKKRKFIVNNNMDLTTICETVTSYYEKEYDLERKNKTQILENISAYSSEYFSPIDVVTNKKKVTKKTVSIHWYNASWYSSKQKFLNKLKKLLNIITFGCFGKILEKIKNEKRK